MGSAWCRSGARRRGRQMCGQATFAQLRRDLERTRIARYSRTPGRSPMPHHRERTPMTQSLSLARQFVDNEDGQDVVEYGLLIATIAIVVLLATAAFGASIGAWFNTLGGRITTTGTR